MRAQPHAPWDWVPPTPALLASPRPGPSHTPPRLGAPPPTVAVRLVAVAQNGQRVPARLGVGLFRHGLRGPGRAGVLRPRVPLGGGHYEALGHGAPSDSPAGSCTLEGRGGNRVGRAERRAGPGRGGRGVRAASRARATSTPGSETQRECRAGPAWVKGAGLACPARPCPRGPPVSRAGSPGAWSIPEGRDSPTGPSTMSRMGRLGRQGRMGETTGRIGRHAPLPRPCTIGNRRTVARLGPRLSPQDPLMLAL